MPLDGNPTLDLHLHLKQGDALNSLATELLYGGAAGGGKSHLMRTAAILWACAIPGLQIYLFRRISADLVRNHMEGPKGFRAILAPLVKAGIVTVIQDEIRFWTGSKIYLCHCNEEPDVYKYQGAEIHVLLIDEITHFTEVMYRFLRNRLRMVGVSLPAGYVGLFPRIICSGNPGNIGHQWVKSTWVDDVEPGAVRRMSNAEGGMLRAFIPARLEDNPSMAADDPLYEGRLEGLGSAALVKAMRWGSWDVIEGAFFDCWDAARHVIRPFPIPAHWLRFRSGDWGSAKPFSFGWWAVASDDTQVENALGQKIVIPRGCMVRYREWYGAAKTPDGKSIPNQGIKLDADAVGRELLSIESKADELNKIDFGVLDPAAFNEDGGPSIAQRLMLGSAIKGSPQVLWRKADNKRVVKVGAMVGWDTMRERMVGDVDGRPMICMFSTCLDSSRTIPVLQHDRHRPEDVNSEMEDHAGDEWRYACNSRPWVRDKAPALVPVDSWSRAAARDDRNSGGANDWKTV